MTFTQETVRELAGFKGTDAPVTSCYLDVDGRRYVRHEDYELRLDAMLKEARERANGSGPSIGEDLKRIADHVRGGVDRSRVRGLAMFSCAAHGLWQTFELPVAVRNQVVVNHTPHVRQLESVLDEYERFGVLLADRQRARMFVFELGELVDKSELFDQLPRHDDDGGEWDRDHVRDHTAAVAHRHLRRAAQVAFQEFQERGFDHLIVGAPDEIANELEGLLHSYLKERIAGRVNVPVNASDEEIRQAALDVEAGVERAKEAAAVERLRGAVGSGNGGVAGVDATLRALVERRVEMLLVSDGFETPGWRCRACNYVAAKGRTCPVCDAKMDKVDDVVEEAIEEALGQSCKVEICQGNADLDVLGRIGAVLRF